MWMLALDFEWDTVWRYLWHPLIREGAWITLQVAVLAQILGILLGTVLAVLGSGKNPVGRGFTGAYVWLFRGTPVLLQLFILYIGIPRFFDEPRLTQELTAYRAAIIAFGLNEAAYMAEIIRAGIISVETGQTDAARSLGMRQLQVMRHVVLPQAVRVVVPPTGNEFIAMLKNTSLASAIGLEELFLRTRAIYAVNFDILELLVVAAIWYLAFTTVFSLLQAELERALAIADRDRPMTILSRMIEIMGGRRGVVWKGPGRPPTMGAE